MDAVVIVLTALGAAAALLLVRAGIDHLRHPATLAAVLAGRRASGPAARSAAASLAVAELLVGALVLAALLLGPPGLRWALAAQGVLYLGFSASLLVRHRRDDRTDCGCSRLPAAVGPAAVCRAGGLAVTSALAAIAYPLLAIPALAPGAAATALLVTGAVTLTVLLHNLPAAIDGVPGRAQPRGAS